MPKNIYPDANEPLFEPSVFRRLCRRSVLFYGVAVSVIVMVAAEPMPLTIPYGPALNF
jgi:hypothetical protein